MDLPRILISPDIDLTDEQVAELEGPPITDEEFDRLNPTTPPIEPPINAPVHHAFCSCYLCQEWRDRQPKKPH